MYLSTFQSSSLGNVLEQTCMPFDLVLKNWVERECGTAMAAPAAPVATVLVEITAS